MDNLIDALCAYALTKDVVRADANRILNSVRPEFDLENVVSGISLDCWGRARRCAQAIRELDIQVIAPWDLPGNLRRLVQPPRGLFVRGPAAVLYGKSEAIVGSRKASPGPQDWAKERAIEAVERGYGRQDISGGSAISVVLFVLVLAISLAQRYFTRERN